MKIRDYAAARVRYGYVRIHRLLRREGFLINRKRVYRQYCEEGLNRQYKTSKNRRFAPPLVVSKAKIETWRTASLKAV